ERLFEYLLTQYLARALPGTYSVLQMLNVIAIEPVAQTGARNSFVRRNFRWEEIPKIVSDPVEIPARVYGWETNSLNIDRIIHHVSSLLISLNLPVCTAQPTDRLVRAYGDIASYPTPPTPSSLVMPFYYFEIAGKPYELAIILRALPASNGK